MLGFKLDVYRQTKILSQPILIEGQRGGGKTTLMRSFAAQLTSSLLKKPDGKPAAKKYIEVNGSSFKSVSGFVDSIVTPNQDAEVTIAIDEVHTLEKKVHDWLLSVLLPDSQTLRSHASHSGMDFEFDFRNISFIAATTNPEKLSDAMKTRFFRVQLEDYSISEMIKIIKLHAPDVSFSDEAVKELALVSRGTARKGKDMALASRDYLTVKQDDKENFNLKDFNALKKHLRIYPLGLLENEVKALNALHVHRGLTLTGLACKLQLDPTTVRRDVEKYLLEKELLTIDGLRFITKRGQEVLKEINA